MAMKRFITYVETTDGTVHGPFRVTYRHRQQMEKTCKARGEDPTGTFAEHILAWAASTKTEDTTQRLSGLTIAEWEDAITDYTNQEAEDGELDPTQTEASAAS